MFFNPFTLFKAPLFNPRCTFADGTVTGLHPYCLDQRREANPEEFYRRTLLGEFSADFKRLATYQSACLDRTGTAPHLCINIDALTPFDEILQFLDAVAQHLSPVRMEFTVDPFLLDRVPFEDYQYGLSALLTPQGVRLGIRHSLITEQAFADGGRVPFDTALVDPNMLYTAMVNKTKRLALHEWVERMRENNVEVAAFGLADADLVSAALDLGIGSGIGKAVGKGAPVMSFNLKTLVPKRGAFNA